MADCVLNGLAHVDADNPDGVIADATGWRQPVEATLARGEDGWRVTRVKVPLRDGSGALPAPAGEAPLFARPRQVEAPPSCVLADAGDAAVARYLAFHDAYNTALGFGSEGPADPDAVALRETAVDAAVGGSRVPVDAGIRRAGCTLPDGHRTVVGACAHPSSRTPRSRWRARSGSRPFPSCPGAFDVCPDGRRGGEYGTHGRGTRPCVHGRHR